MAIHHQALFEPAVSVHKMPWHMKMSYKGVYGAVNSIWMSILSHAEYAELLLDGEIELGEAYFALRRRGNHGREGGGRGPVFRILERDGLVHVHVVPNVPAKTLLHQRQEARRASLVYTDMLRSYDSPMFCGYRPLKADHSMYFSSGKGYINGLEIQDLAQGKIHQTPRCLQKTIPPFN